MLPVPTIEQLAEFSGRPDTSYTGYATSCLIQAALMLTIVAEIDIADFGSLSANDQALATNGMLAMADYIYLRQPYQQIIASPMQNENIGSYAYSKPLAEIARNAQALEVTVEKTGVLWYDLAVQYLAKRQRANGVFFGQLMLFEKQSSEDTVFIRCDDDGNLVILGPGDRDKVDMPFDINSQMFPQDPA